MWVAAGLRLCMRGKDGSLLSCTQQTVASGLLPPRRPDSLVAGGAGITSISMRGKDGSLLSCKGALCVRPLSHQWGVKRSPGCLAPLAPLAAGACVLLRSRQRARVCMNAAAGDGETKGRVTASSLVAGEGGLAVPDAGRAGGKKTNMSRQDAQGSWAGPGQRQGWQPAGDRHARPKLQLPAVGRPYMPSRPAPSHLRRHAGRLTPTHA